MMLASLIEPESKGEMTKDTQEEKNKKQKEKKTTDQHFSHDAGSLREPESKGEMTKENQEEKNKQKERKMPISKIQPWCWLAQQNMKEKEMIKESKKKVLWTQEEKDKETSIARKEEENSKTQMENLNDLLLRTNSWNKELNSLSMKRNPHNNNLNIVQQKTLHTYLRNCREISTANNLKASQQKTCTLCRPCDDVSVWKAVAESIWNLLGSWVWCNIVNSCCTWA